MMKLRCERGDPGRGDSERGDSERGAVAVEFALLLPILVALLLGIMEFGFAYNAQVTVTNAAREGARSMAITGNPTTARTAVKAAATTLNPAITDSEVSIKSPDGTVMTTCTGGTTTTLVVTYPFKFFTGFFGSGLTMTGKAAMRCGG